MTKKTQRNAITKKITVATLIAIFSLMSAFTGTIAWFSTNREVNVTGASFKVQTPTGIGFELYYLKGFDLDDDGDIDKKGNYDPALQEHIGYEIVPNNSTAIFEGAYHEVEGEQVLIEPDPTSVSHLWPAHRLTYAMYLSGGNYNNFILDSWLETSNAKPSKIFSIDGDVVDAASFSTQQSEHDLYVLNSGSYIIADTYDSEIDTYYYVSNLSSITSLSWAINIYGAAYKIADQGNTLDTISYGFNTFKNESTDKFTYSQTLPAPNPAEATNLNVSSGTTGSGAVTVLYFSIEFSNSSDTFYRLSDDGNYYIKDSVNGNSNCYKGLSLSSLVFKLL